MKEQKTKRMVRKNRTLRKWLQADNKLYTNSRDSPGIIAEKESKVRGVCR
jgi:hypothetical protein